MSTLKFFNSKPVVTLWLLLNTAAFVYVGLAMSNFFDDHFKPARPEFNFSWYYFFICLLTAKNIYSSVKLLKRKSQKADSKLN